MVIDSKQPYYGGWFAINDYCFHYSRMLGNPIPEDYAGWNNPKAPWIHQSWYNDIYPKGTLYLSKAFNWLGSQVGFSGALSLNLLSIFASCMLLPLVMFFFNQEPFSFIMFGIFTRWIFIYTEVGNISWALFLSVLLGYILIKRLDYKFIVLGLAFFIHRWGFVLLLLIFIVELALRLWNKKIYYKLPYWWVYIFVVIAGIYSAITTGEMGVSRAMGLFWLPVFIYLGKKVKEAKPAMRLFVVGSFLLFFPLQMFWLGVTIETGWAVAGEMGLLPCPL